MSTAAKGVHHVAVCVTNFERSKPYYDKVLGWLGYQPAVNATGYPHKNPEGKVCIYAGAAGLFAIWEAEAGNKGNKFTDYNVGLHHMAFAAPSREAVDELHKNLVGANLQVTDPPKDYQYLPGYYAVFFRDPDGLKLEFAFNS